jgi:hypothetical protein
MDRGAMTIGKASGACCGHLTMRFVSQRENLATEALAYILNGSKPARAALHRLIAVKVPAFPPIARVSTQEAAGEESRPT